MRTFFALRCSKPDRVCDIDVLEDGFKAMEYLRAGNGHGPRCDLVLLDLNLPGISGFEVLECIKTTEKLERCFR